MLFQQQCCVSNLMACIYMLSGITCGERSWEVLTMFSDGFVTLSLSLADYNEWNFYPNSAWWSRPEWVGDNLHVSTCRITKDKGFWKKLWWKHQAQRSLSSFPDVQVREKQQLANYLTSQWLFLFPTYKHITKKCMLYY